MAKKAETAIEGFSTEKMGAGWKRCPQCEGYVKVLMAVQNGGGGRSKTAALRG